METIKGIILLTLLALPLLFQIVFGGSFISFSRKMPFWLICIISVLLWLASYYFCAEMITNNLKKMNSHDGLPFVGLLVIESIIAIVLLLTICIQIAVKYYRKRKRIFFNS